MFRLQAGHPGQPGAGYPAAGVPVADESAASGPPTDDAGAGHPATGVPEAGEPGSGDDSLEALPLGADDVAPDFRAALRAAPFWVAAPFFGAAALLVAVSLVAVSLSALFVDANRLMTDRATSAADWRCGFLAGDRFGPAARGRPAPTFGAIAAFSEFAVLAMPAPLAGPVGFATPAALALAAAASTFFLACLAAFFAALDDLRTFFKCTFAARTSSLARSARAAAFLACATKRCGAVFSLVRATLGVTATMCASLGEPVVELSPGQCHCHETFMSGSTRNR